MNRPQLALDPRHQTMVFLPKEEGGACQYHHSPHLDLFELSDFHSHLVLRKSHPKSIAVLSQYNHIYSTMSY